MLKKGIGFFVLLLVVSAMAQSKLISKQTVAPNANFALTDSIPLAIDSSLIVTEDILTPHLLKVRDSLTNVIWLDSVSKGYGFALFSLENIIKSVGSKEKVIYQKGEVLRKGDVWILAVIAVLLILFSILKNAFGKQLAAVVQSFYSNRALTNLNKEDNLVTSWSFLLLFIQFGFVIGLFFYLVAQHNALPAAQGGFGFFISISIGVILLYLLKILILRFIGFIFNIQKPIHHYISILYLSYFNASLLFFPIVIAFALSPYEQGSWYVLIGMLTLIVIFIFQFIRAAVNILPHYTFPKLYLFLYLCTLEICPILILIKTIGL